MSSRYLVLEDGTVLKGKGFGHDEASYGEVVFSTGMDGYQEGLTDPSFCGQILVFTYPLIGNYGIKKEYNQSDAGAQVSGVVVSEYCDVPSPMYGGEPLGNLLTESRVPGISGIDTRSLVVKIRNSGTLKGAIISDEKSISETLEQLRSRPLPSDSNLVARVSCKNATYIDSRKDLTVGILDCGVKKSIVSELSSRFNVRILPYNATSQEIEDSKIDGLLISNGPGNPAHPDLLGTSVRTVSDLSSVMPLMGICFGSQIIALAMGGGTYKMKFGHRGSNQPVKFDGRVYITSQNHGYAVDAESLSGTELIVNQVNLNDGTVEGVAHKDLPIFTTQYHPEASPGPKDTMFLFDRFGRMMEASK